MRLNLPRALLHRADVLFVDEPTSGLDPATAADVWAVIRAQADAGRTVSHGDVPPPVPDQVEAGAGEDANCVRVVVAAGEGAAVEVLL